MEQKRVVKDPMHPKNKKLQCFFCIKNYQIVVFE